jgi:hypothetical protein
VTKEQSLGFAAGVLRSVWSLEVLLLLYREPARAWAVPDIVAELRANTRIVVQSLTELEAAGLVRPEGSGLHRYEPATPDLAQSAADLFTLYEQEPRSVVMAILKAPKDTIQMFADAFRFRK